MAYHQYNRNSGGAHDYPNAYGFSRPSMDLPRPLEPRPSLQTSRSDMSGTQRRPEAFRSPVSSDSRSQHPSLPGLKDILVDTPIGPGPAAQDSWSGQARPLPYYQTNDSHYSTNGLHPPMALYPPHTQAGSYQPPQGRSFEVPILDTNRVARHPPQSLPLSPYSSYPDATRDYWDARPEGMRRPSTASYGYNVPQTAFRQEEQNYVHTPNYERPSGSPMTPLSAENQKQYIGTKEVPGEGSFHVYEGGYRIPTHVDGEQVNPAWGLTKANKPRKRLALACLDCREKKIKCEPGALSCLQCEKVKRPCRRAPGQTSQTSNTTVSWQDASASPVRKAPSTSDPNPTTDRAIEGESLHKRRTRADPSPPNLESSKRHRSASPIANGDDTPQSQNNLPPQLSEAPMPKFSEAAQGHFITFDDDPYVVDPDITLHLLGMYFTHMNNAVYWLFPRHHFVHWVKTTAGAKCQNERTVLYAMLAAASIFGPADALAFGKRCAQVAGDAIREQVGKFNMSMAQARMLLAHYHFARGNQHAPWEYIGGALRTINYLRLNTEEGGCLDAGPSLAQARIEFCLSLEQLAECKRRTFWSCFLMDRLSDPSTCQIKPEDVFVRLPCSEESYETGQPSDAPYFPNEHLDSASTLLTPASPLAPMAWLALVAAIWGDVTDFIFRIRQRPSSTYRAPYEAFYSETRNRMQGWVTRLPPHLQYSEENLDRSIQLGYAEALITMHSIYHMAHMKLNRCLRHAEMSDFVTRNVREAHSHAEKQLHMMGAISQANRDIVIDGVRSRYVLSTPFPGYATLTATNIVGAGGPESTLQPSLDLIQGGLVCLRELSAFWTCAKDQLRACEKRFYEVKNTLTSGQKSSSGAWLGRNWGLDKPVERELKDEDDCIYGLGNSTEAIKLYFDAFHDEVESRIQGRALRIAP